MVAREVKLPYKGYKDPPEPRRLVGKSQIPDSSSYLSGVRLVGKHGEIRTGPQKRRLPVQPAQREGQTHPMALVDLHSKITGFAFGTDLYSLANDGSNRVTGSHRKASPLRPAPRDPYSGT